MEEKYINFYLIIFFNLMTTDKDFHLFHQTTNFIYMHSLITYDLHKVKKKRKTKTQYEIRF